MAGNTTGTETSIGTVIIIMDIDPIIIVDPVIMVDPAIIITQGLIIRVVGTMEAGIDEKKKFARSSMKPMRVQSNRHLLLQTVSRISYT